MPPFVQHNRAITQLAITTEGQPDIWRDIYRVQNLPAIPAGSIIRVHLAKQVENPSDFPAAVAWLRKFYLAKPDGAEIDLSLGGHPTSNGQLGLNITRESHYESGTESCIYRVTSDLPAGCKIAYEARAKSSTYTGYVQIWDKGCLTVEIEEPCTFQSQIDALSQRIAALEAIQ